MLRIIGKRTDLAPIVFVVAVVCVLTTLTGCVTSGEPPAVAAGEPAAAPNAEGGGETAIPPPPTDDVGAGDPGPINAAVVDSTARVTPTEPSDAADVDPTGSDPTGSDSGAADPPNNVSPISDSADGVADAGLTAAIAAVDALMAGWDLRTLVAHRFIAFLPRAGLTRDFRLMVGRNPPAGFIVYPWNYRTPEQLRVVTSELQLMVGADATGIGAFVSADQEGGRVNALRFESIVRFPSAFRLGSYRNTDLMEATAFVRAFEMQALGVNMNLAPVLDLYDVEDATIIGDRSMGPDPAAVAELGVAYLAGVERAGGMAVIKHFPGHGITTVDSHSRLPVVDRTLEQLREYELVPFRAAIEAGAELVMTAHILYPEIDPEFPATLSSVFMRDLLRDELGFRGVVMTDGLEMGALSDHYPLRVTLRQAIRNSVDLILLYTRYDLEQTVTLVVDMVESGELTRTDVEDGVRRVLLLKQRKGLIGPPTR